MTLLRVFLEGLTFGLLEMIHWSRFRIVDLSIAGPEDAFNVDTTQSFPCWLTFFIHIIVGQEAPIIAEEET